MKIYIFLKFKQETIVIKISLFYEVRCEFTRKNNFDSNTI